MANRKVYVAGSGEPITVRCWGRHQANRVAWKCCAGVQPRTHGKQSGGELWWRTQQVNRRWRTGKAGTFRRMRANPQAAWGMSTKAGGVVKAEGLRQGRSNAVLGRIQAVAVGGKGNVRNRSHG